MIFKTKKIDSVETLSEILKKTRHEASTSLKEIARSTKIPQRFLRSLEDGDYDHLPADVYVKGYLRAYGRFFKKRPETLIRIFQREKQILKNLRKERTPKHGHKNLQFPRFVITPQRLAWILVVVALIGVSVYFWYELDLFKSAPEINLITPSNNFTTDQDFVLCSGRVSQEAEVMLNSEFLWTDENGRFKELVPLQKGLNTIQIAAKNKLGKQRLIKRYIIKY